MDDRDEQHRLEILPLEDVDPDAAYPARPAKRRWFLDAPLWMYLTTALVLTLVIFRVFVWLLS